MNTLIMNCLYFIAVAISIVSLSKLSASHAYTFDLLHLHFSPRSPSYDPTLTHTQRVARALSQGSSNINAATVISADTTNGLYIMDYSIGTPSVQVSGSLSAGSDLIWLPCKTSAFDLTRSKTYSRIPCNTTRCNSLPTTTCSNNTCHYSMTYERGPSTSGDFSMDTVKFVNGYSLTNVSFGCETSNGISTGGVGLGKGNSSLVKQMGAPKFSYCLAPLTSGSSGGGKLNFGDSAVVGGTGTESTPLITKSSPSFYYAHLESMVIGNDRMIKVDFNEDILLELGSTVTMLHHDQYWGLIDALNVSMPLNETVVNENFTLCYSSMSNFPRITLQFNGTIEGGIVWKPENVFAQTGEKEWCTALGIADVGDDAIYGSFAQTDFFVGIDLSAKTVNFKSANCSE